MRHELPEEEKAVVPVQKGRYDSPRAEARELAYRPFLACALSRLSYLADTWRHELLMR